MTNTKEQVLELAKKHGAIIEEKHVGSPIAVYFDELPKLLAYTAAIEERNLARVAMLVDLLKRLPTRFDAGMPTYRIEVNKVLGSAIQQTADAFLAERDARVLEPVFDAWDDLLEDLELHGMHGFEPYIRSKEKFRRIAAEKRKQAGETEAEQCPNCDTDLPKGCGGRFKNEGHHCWLNRKAGESGKEGGE